MIIRIARPEDGQGMLQLIESHPATGKLQILYTRRPDAYSSYTMECADAEMIVCADKENKLVAQVVCLPRKLYIGGEIHTVGYVTGLHKADGAFVNIIRMLEYGRNRSIVQEYFCSFLENNQNAFELFAKRGLVHPIDEYTTFLLYPKAIRPVRHSLSLCQATADDEERLLHFYHEEGARHSYFPAFATLSEFPGLSVSDFYLLKEGSEVVAAGALWDQRAYKQYVASSYSGIYKLATHFNPLLRALRFPPLPRIGAIANFAYLSFVLSREDDAMLTRIMLSGLAKVGQAYDCLTIGAARGSVLDEYLKGNRHFKFGSRLCAMGRGVGGSAALESSTFEGVPLRFECGLL